METYIFNYKQLTIKTEFCDATCYMTLGIMEHKNSILLFEAVFKA